MLIEVVYKFNVSYDVILSNCNPPPPVATSLHGPKAKKRTCMGKTNSNQMYEKSATNIVFLFMFEKIDAGKVEEEL